MSSDFDKHFNTFAEKFKRFVRVKERMERERADEEAAFLLAYDPKPHKNGWFCLHRCCYREEELPWFNQEEADEVNFVEWWKQYVKGFHDFGIDVVFGECLLEEDKQIRRRKG